MRAGIRTKIDGRDILRSAFSLFPGFFGYVGADFVSAGGRIKGVMFWDRALSPNELRIADLDSLEHQHVSTHREAGKGSG